MATTGTFMELANSFGFGAAMLLAFAYIFYKIYLATDKREKESRCKYEELILDVQSENKKREDEMKATLKDNQEKNDKRDSEYRAIIQKLSENFDVVKEIRTKFDDFEVKFEDLESEIKNSNRKI